MQRAIWVYIMGTVVLTAGIVAVGAPLMAKNQAAGGGVLFLSAVVPMAMAFIAHRLSGARGNPFKGLVWGPTPYYFAVWLGGVAVGLIGALLCLGLGLARFDPEMTDYIEMAIAQAEAGGQAMPSGAEDGIRIVGMVTAIAGPILGPWFLTVVFCLSTFPWLGFLFRRLMVGGKLRAMLILALIWFFLNVANGLIPNPMAEEMSMPIRMLLGALMGAAAAPAIVWLFLRTGSAVIPALAQASLQGILSACTVFFSDVNMLLGIPMGVITILSVLLTGVALWIWKDPSGEQLAVAAVAGDGTPLTPLQVEMLTREVTAAPPEPVPSEAVVNETVATL